MRLEMGPIYIKDIQFESESKIEDGIPVSYTHLMECLEKKMN